MLCLTPFYELNNICVHSKDKKSWGISISFSMLCILGRSGDLRNFLCFHSFPLLMYSHDVVKTPDCSLFVWTTYSSFNANFQRSYNKEWCRVSPCKRAYEIVNRPENFQRYGNLNLRELKDFSTRSRKIRRSHQCLYSSLFKQETSIYNSKWKHERIMLISLFSILQVLTVNLKILWGNTFLSSLFPLDLADDRKKESDRWKGGESLYFWIALSHLLWVSNK